MMDDQQVAARLRQILGAQPGPVNVSKLANRVNASLGQLKRVIRSLPAEFGLYKQKQTGGRSSHVVVCYAAQHSSDIQGQQQATVDANAHSNTSSSTYCSTCRQAFSSESQLQTHLAGARHKVTLLGQQLRSSGSFHANMQGLQVSEFREANDLKLNEPRLLQLLVENVGSTTHTLRAAYQVRSLPDVRVLTDCGAGGLLLAPGLRQLWVDVEATPRSHGILCTLIMLDFGFVIARELRVECDPFSGDSSIPDISATAPFVRRRARNLLPLHPPDYVPGEKEPRPRLPFQRPPRQHKVPHRLRQLVTDKDTAALQAELDAVKQAAPAGLKQHLDKMHMLLHLEELQQELDVRHYDMQGVTLQPGGNRRLLGLQVPGLAEARPSVMRGDALYVCRTDGADGNREWQGFVHVVQREQVLLRFNSQFHALANRVAGLQYNVRFAIKRTAFVFMHEALQLAAGGAGAGLQPQLLLPPAGARSVPGRGIRIPSWRNPNIGSNPEQAEAVRCIVNGTSGDLPFIIWGPPGTGKTCTLVEAATQVLRLLPESRLLLVAPSNLAADLLAVRLLDSGRTKSEMLRVCAFSRPKEDLLRGLEEVACWDDATGAFQLPPLQRLTGARVRVVVVTALMAAKLNALGVPTGHFTHIMLDEAGHAEEPLALCALAGLAGPSTSVVLAGDPKQLGPVIHSGLAKEAGLGTSLLERLTSLPPYAARVEGGSSSGSDTSPLRGGRGSDQQHSAEGLIVKLVRNYRSHPKLLELPSRLFYGGELEACASPEITHTLLHWDKLPNKEFPMLFHCIVGADEREANSPSWFNVQEAKQVLLYIRELMAVRRFTRLTADQICVVTPYRKQAQKIRALLQKDYPSVQVGSVEQLQGQERRVVIISTVRSTPQYLEHDFTHKLGFVGAAKRFNVAITRAQALMVIVGNPAVLMHDKHWLALLMTCQAHGAVTGQPMPDLTEAAAAFAAEHAASSSFGQAGSSGNGFSSGIIGAGSALQQQVAQLEKLMASVTLSRAEEEVAAQQRLLETLGFSTLVDEAGGGMVRHE